MILNFFTVILLSIGKPTAVCNTDDHHPENDGYFHEGVGGESNSTRVNYAHGQKLLDSVWAGDGTNFTQVTMVQKLNISPFTHGLVLIEFGYDPYGELVLCDPATDTSCRAPCDVTPVCKRFLHSHNCDLTGLSSH